MMAKRLFSYLLFSMTLGEWLFQSSVFAASSPAQFFKYDLRCDAIQKVEITSDSAEKQFTVVLHLSESEKAFLLDRSGHHTVEIFFRKQRLGRWSSQSKKSQIESGIISLGPYRSKKHAKLMAVRVACREL